MSVRVLVTGGAGFIGSHLCDRLLKSGYDVFAVDDLSLGRRENLQHLKGRNDFQFLEMDVCSQSELDALFSAQGFDTVFHMAANSDIARSHAEPSTDVVATFQTTYAVLEAMRKHRVANIVFASTSAIYGEARGALREDHGPLKPISHYGAAKLSSEAFISSYAENYGMRAWIPRFPNVVGERATHGAVFDFVNKLAATPERLEVLGDGTQIKPYLHVSDLIEAVLMARDRFDEKVNIFNVAGTTRCSVKRMAEIVVEEAGTGASIAFTGGDRGWVGDVPSVEYDTSKLQQLGWTPQLDAEEAIRVTARWLIEHPR
jgi:UDP-glucose 4-epimerase